MASAEAHSKSFDISGYVSIPLKSKVEVKAFQQMQVSCSQASQQAADPAAACIGAGHLLICADWARGDVQRWVYPKKVEGLQVEANHLNWHDRPVFASAARQHASQNP